MVRMALRGIMTRRLLKDEFNGVPRQDKIEPLLPAPGILVTLDNSPQSRDLPVFEQRADQKCTIQTLHSLPNEKESDSKSSSDARFNSILRFKREMTARRPGRDIYQISSRPNDH